LSEKISPYSLNEENLMPLAQRAVAELIGTFWLVFGGCGSAVFAAAFPNVGIGLHGVSLAFGLTVLTMAYAIGHISGCHLNPAGNYPGRLRSPVQSALLHFGRREKRVPLKGIPDGLKDIFGMLTSGGKIPANATELLGTLQRAKPA